MTQLSRASYLARLPLRKMKTVNIRRHQRVRKQGVVGLRVRRKFREAPDVDGCSLCKFRSTKEKGPVSTEGFGVWLERLTL